MTGTIVTPTLSMKGWIKNPTERLDYALAYFFESNKSESYVFQDNIVSAQAIIQKHGNDLTGLINDLQDTMQTYLSRQFDSVSVEVTDTSPDAIRDISSKVTINIYCLVTHDGKQFSAANVFELANSRFKLVTDVMRGSVL